MKKIVLTGGGSAGHFTPHLALLPALRELGFDVYYVGSHTGIERGLAEKAGLAYYPIASGKLRRYFDLRNVTDVFRVVKGYGDALRILKKIKPDLVFSKGGFVTVPVLAAARTLGVTSVIHESDFTPGLANRLAAPFAAKICVCFPETLSRVPKRKGVLTGSPVRLELLAGSREAGIKRCGFTGPSKPVLLVTGGSQGSAIINASFREILPKILDRFWAIHLCGKGNLMESPPPGYAQFEYVQDGLADLYALADIVVSRAGAGTLFEMLAMKKPHLLIPLSKGASRGDQILNAASFERQGFSMVLPEEEMTPERLLGQTNALYEKRQGFSSRMAAHEGTNGIKSVMETLAKALETNV
jgi:UDP-N-acetylglucosamine--N-acetylmuramyl-(pentapeptide) pyrophosphoryl-undecaprenol N-acetylglucosamine transferase